MRLELKYIVSRSVVAEILHDIKKIFEIEKYKNKHSHYNNTNIYYDTLDYKFYREKSEGYNIRKKIRIRISKFINENHFSRSQIEIKNRRGFESEKKIIKIHNIENFDFNNINTYMIKNHKIYFKDKLFPVLTTIYERKSFISKIYDNLRLTIDNNILTSSVHNKITYKNNGFFILDPKYNILEFKLNNEMPVFLKHLISKYHLSQVTFSKYAKSLDLIYSKYYKF